VLQIFRSVVDAPLPRCARLGAAARQVDADIIVIIARPDRPSSIVAPNRKSRKRNRRRRLEQVEQHRAAQLRARVTTAKVIDGGSSASGLPRRQIAITSASATNCAVIAELIDQPTTRRENRSITAAT
jgi:hypothetical protein